MAMKPAEMNSVLSKLAICLNCSASATGVSGLTTQSTESYIHYTSDNNSSLTSETSVIPKETMFSTYRNETGDNLMNGTGDNLMNDTGDNLMRADMEDFSYRDSTSIDEEMKKSLLVNFNNNSNDGWLDNASSYATDNCSTTSNVTLLNMENTTVEVTETDLDSNSSNLPSEQYLDNTSNIFTDNFISTESIPPLNSVSVASSTVDGDSKNDGLTSVMESEELTSLIATTLQTLLTQSTDFVSTSQYTENISPMIHETTADVAVSTEYHSSQGNTVPTGGTASSWEPSFAPDATNKKHSTAITTEMTSTLEESHGMCKINP
jgi:hypothetical protein